MIRYEFDQPHSRSNNNRNSRNRDSGGSLGSEDSRGMADIPSPMLSIKEIKIPEKKQNSQKRHIGHALPADFFNKPEGSNNSPTRHRSLFRNTDTIPEGRRPSMRPPGGHRENYFGSEDSSSSEGEGGMINPQTVQKVHNVEVEPRMRADSNLEDLKSIYSSNKASLLSLGFKIKALQQKIRDWVNKKYSKLKEFEDEEEKEMDLGDYVFEKIRLTKRYALLEDNQKGLEIEIKRLESLQKGSGDEKIGKTQKLKQSKRKFSGKNKEHRLSKDDPRDAYQPARDVPLLDDVIINTMAIPIPITSSGHPDDGCCYGVQRYCSRLCGDCCDRCFIECQCLQRDRACDCCLEILNCDCENCTRRLEDCLCNCRCCSIDALAGGCAACFGCVGEVVSTGCGKLGGCMNKCCLAPIQNFNCGQMGRCFSQCCEGCVNGFFYFLFCGCCCGS